MSEESAPERKRYRLGDKVIRARETDLRAKGKDRWDYFDNIVDGLAIRISKSGVKSWVLWYRVDGRQVRDTFARYPLVSVADARQRAKDKLEAVQAGKDPRHEKARQQAQEAKRRAETFGEVAKTYKSGHLAKIKTGDELWQRVEDDLLPEWRDLPIRDIGRGAVMALLDRVERDKGIYARNRRLALIRHILNFALDRELVDANVATRIKLLPEPERQRLLTDAELVEVWRASDRLGEAFGRFTKALILTGQRRREVSDMARAEVDFDADLWVIPTARMKAGVAHAVPLAPSVKDLIEGAPVLENAKTYIFTTGRRDDAPISGFNKLKEQLDRFILEARQEDDPEAKPMPDWRLHDLRRTFRSGLSKLRIPPHIAERCIAHLPEGIQRVYDVHEYDDEKRHAFEAWANYVARLIQPAGNVTPIDDARGKRAKG